MSAWSFDGSGALESLVTDFVPVLGLFFLCFLLFRRWGLDEEDIWIISPLQSKKVNNTFKVLNVPCQ